MHNEEVKNSLNFVPSREILMFRQTFLESTQKFAQKMSVKGERGAYDNDNRNFTVVGVSPFVEKIF